MKRKKNTHRNRLYKIVFNSKQNDTNIYWRLDLYDVEKYYIFLNSD